MQSDRQKTSGRTARHPAARTGRTAAVRSGSSSLTGAITATRPRVGSPRPSSPRNILGCTVIEQCQVSLAFPDRREFGQCIGRRGTSRPVTVVARTTTIATQPEDAMALPTDRSRGSEHDHWDPTLPLARLFDADTLSRLRRDETGGVHVAQGRISGTPVVAYCSDGTRTGGAVDVEGCSHIVAAIDMALAQRCPVIGLWRNLGDRQPEAVDTLDGLGRIFAAMVNASGGVPQISVVLGPVVGSAAYGPALSDVVLMSSAALLAIGPDDPRSDAGYAATGRLGRLDTSGRGSGVAHLILDTEHEALSTARAISTLLGRPGAFDTHDPAPPADLAVHLPETPRRAYDVRPLVRAILDQSQEHAFVELQPRWAPNVVVGLGRLAGRTIGVVANNPIRKGGCLDALSGEKPARFVRMCDSFGIPLVVVVDVPGYLPGVEQEWGGVVRRGAKLLHAFAEAAVPRVTLVVRKAYGGAYIAMNSRSLGSTAVLAWPHAQVAVMSADAAVDVLHRRALAAAGDDKRDALRARLVADHEQCVAGLQRGMDIGVIDAVIDPSLSRAKVVAALAAAPAARGRHRNIPL
jgi:acetyl-CoA/propionyl-CoA carboxylase carboxyl transferase subunit